LFGADGLDIDSSSAVTVRNSDFFAHDDGIALKSGKDWWGRHVGKATENILIENVRSHSFVGAALAIGSETSGGIRNVTVRHFEVDGTELGLSIKTERGRGGTIEDCSFENVTIRGTGCAALQLNMQYHIGIPVGNATTTPIMRNISFTGINATGVVSHPGFCVPLGASADMAQSIDGVGSQSLAIFKGIAESPLRDVNVENVRLSGPSSIDSAAAVQCVDATVQSRAFDVDGKPAVVACQ
jgi:polygalacturonase